VSRLIGVAWLYPARQLQPVDIGLDLDRAAVFAVTSMFVSLYARMSFEQTQRRAS
jgi:hypothetical protein